MFKTQYTGETTVLNPAQYSFKLNVSSVSAPLRCHHLETLVQVAATTKTHSEFIKDFDSDSNAHPVKQ